MTDVAERDAFAHSVLLKRLELGKSTCSVVFYAVTFTRLICLVIYVLARLPQGSLCRYT